MQRIDHPTAAVALPAPGAPGAPGYFAEAPPGGPGVPTVVTADWANAIQEELIALITYAGIAPAKIVLAAPLTKRLDAVWAVGGGNGGRDNAAALANGQTWHVFLILRPDTGVVDALFSQSPTAPTLPANYTRFRRLGAVILEAASTNIREFIQVGDWFHLKTRSTDFAAQANGGGVAYLRQITVPQGIKVEAHVYFQSTGTVNTSAYLSGIFDPDFGVPAAFGGATQWAQVRRLSVYQAASGADLAYGTVVAQVFTDAARQVYTFSSDPSDVIALGVLRWRDERGKFF